MATITVQRTLLPAAQQTSLPLRSASISSTTDTTATTSSSTEPLSSRLVPQKHVRSESQMMRTGLNRPTYKMGDPPPWLTQDQPGDHPQGTLSAARSLHPRGARGAVPSSIYSHDTDLNLYEVDEDDEVMTATVPPLQIRVPPQPVVLPDTAGAGSTTKSSRLPLFKQVRSMLQRQSPTGTSPPTNVRWDEYSGEMSANGKAPYVQPSTYVPPSTYRTRDDAPSNETALRASQPLRARRNLSPVSVLRDDELRSSHDRHLSASSVSVSPVSASPVSSIFVHAYEQPPFATDSSIARPRTAGLPSGLNQGGGQVRRKPAPAQKSPRHSTAFAPGDVADSRAAPINSSLHAEQNIPGLLADSRLSWGSYAFGMTGTTDPSSDTPHYRLENNVPSSRFSWTTIATDTTHSTYPATLSSADAMPPIDFSIFHQSEHSDDDHSIDSGPTSILARSRPIKRLDKEEWSPRPHGTKITPRVVTDPVTPANPARLHKSRVSSTSKALPLPPDLAQPESSLSHVDSLLAQERDLTLQHNNVSKGIMDIEMLERTSPLDVSFATIRNAKKRLAEYRTRLGEIELERREIGILISRIRRKEGAEETLWIRRVTS